MAKDIGNLEPLNEEKFFEEFETLEEDARKEKIRSLVKERNEIGDTNRGLFARAKKAEGFEQDGDGDWIKKTPEKPKEASVKSDEEVMKRLKNMALRVSGITADDEVELFDKWEKDTGRDADSILGNKIFLSELQDLRTTRANAAAADVKGGDGKGSGTKDDPAYWLSKATKNSEGELMFPDDMPKDKKLHAAIIEKMVASTKDDRRFYSDQGRS